MLDLDAISRKWRERWASAKVYEANAKPGQPKFMLTFPYPYMNGYLHVGHFYSSVRVDVMARYKRMRGFNVLFPQAWHCTGSPIENAAQRIREHEEKQWSIMQGMGFSEQQIKEFEDPKKWVDYFPTHAKEAFELMGYSIDFRRSFITTDLNPHYDAFIRWQFNRLREGKYVIKGKFPVVWCTKDNAPVGDHARVEGEGETPQEYILMKYALGDSFIVTATLRPETLYGDTNLWVNPDVEYVKAKVDDEKWIVSESCIKKLREQDKKVHVIEMIPGKSLIGEYVTAPMTNVKIPILPAPFADPELGTGIVRSVPAHAPPDWMALHDLQSDKDLAHKYPSLKTIVPNIQPISVINLPSFGEFPGVEICKQMGIKNQKDAKLDDATKEIYKKEFFSGTMKDSSGPYANLSTEQAKKQLTQDLIESKHGDRMYELTGKVVCRCLTPSIVKIVADQWFLNYGDEHWKKLARECLSDMKLYPEQVRAQFEYVIGWLNNWACTREFGLGTRLPWDEKWVIESLSDSTIYMAYYTFAHIIRDVPKEHLNDALFDYIFHGKGEKPRVKDVDKMREEFLYWYPMDFRNSGKDLIQNHLAFSIFNHVAIFPREKWPRGFSVNGFVTVDGEKMSKSKGNIILMRDMARKFSPDASRFTILSGGEYLDDANWDSELAHSTRIRLHKLQEQLIELRGAGVDEHRSIDAWMESNLSEIIKDTTEHMELGYYRSALQRGFYDLQGALKWYQKRTAGKPNRKLIDRIIKAHILLLAPFTPFFCEEVWETLGEKGFIANANWPSFDPSHIRPELGELEQTMQRTIEDVRTILKLIKVEKPQKIEFFVAASWKFQLYAELEPILKETRDYSTILKKIMGREHFKHHAKDLVPLLQKILKGGLPQKLSTQEHELRMLSDARDFLHSEFGAKIEVHSADGLDDQKARSALPAKPAIKVL